MWPDGPVPHPETRGDFAQLLFELDAAGIGRAVILAGGSERWANSDYVSDMIRSTPERFDLFPDVDCYWSSTYHAPGAAQRLRRTLQKFRPRGFTHYLRDDDDGAWLISAAAREFFEIAEEMRQIVSIHVRPHQLGPLRQLARSFRSTPFLIHHLGFPLYRGITPHFVVQDLLKCAEIENLHLKISGFDIEHLRPWDYPYADVVEIATTLIGAFGGARSHWGSNFPMCTPSMTYRQSLEGVREHVRWNSDHERDQVLGLSFLALLDGQAGPR
jgi:predicted TIM-barrel fold metal-dependent hydrolase